MKHSLVIKKGQTMLLAVLIISTAALAIGVAAAALGSAGLNAASNHRDTLRAYDLAETCLESSLLQFSQGQINPSSNFTAVAGSCNIVVSGISSPYQILATGISGRTTRKIQATVSLNEEVLTVSEHQEIFN